MQLGQQPTRFLIFLKVKQYSPRTQPEIKSHLLNPSHANISLGNCTVRTSPCCCLHACAPLQGLIPWFLGSKSKSTSALKGYKNMAGGYRSSHAKPWSFCAGCGFTTIGGGSALLADAVAAISAVGNGKRVVFSVSLALCLARSSNQLVQILKAEWNTRIVSMSLESLVSFDVCGIHVSSRSASALRLVNLRILFFPWDHFRRLDPCKLSLANGRPIPASERYHYIDIL